jgi:hypothetical protein
LSKPGVLKSIRASQALGAITRKNNWLVTKKIL